MEPDSSTVAWLAVAAAVIAAAALGLTWSMGRGPTRFVTRTAALLACLTTTAAAGLAWANTITDIYPSWSSLLGSSAEVALPAGDFATGSGDGGGRITSFTVAGDGFRMPVYAYLPAGYDQNPKTRYPVLEALDGFPGSPMGWLKMLDATRILNGEIAAARMAPTVVLFPYQTQTPTLDTECTNLVGGPQSESYLTQAVPTAAKARFHVRTDSGAWGLIGYSAGGYCASDLLLRHPTEYAAGASLSGYVTPGIKIGDGSEHTTYNLVWRLHHLPVPAVALYVTCARSDPTALFNAEMLAHAGRAPLSVTTYYIDGGGHNGQTWQVMEAPALDWLSSHLAKPETTATTTAYA